MERYIWIGILSISFCFNCSHIFAQKSPSSHYISIENDKKFFLEKEEVSIDDYDDILFFVRQKYGEDSEQYRFLIPDTAKFRALYGFSFFYEDISSRYTAKDTIRKLHQTLPMIAISYEQALAYCQWAEVLFNVRYKSYTWQCRLPEKADYEMALKKAKITQKESLSLLQVKCNEYCRKTKDGSMGCIIKCRYSSNSISGLTDNVAEYTQDGIIVEGGENTELKFVEAKDNENPIGFRCKVTAISKK
jgi:hypothetical protein